MCDLIMQKFPISRKSVALAGSGSLPAAKSSAGCAPFTKIEHTNGCYVRPPQGPICQDLFFLARAYEDTTPCNLVMRQNSSIHYIPSTSGIPKPPPLNPKKFLGYY